jgi:hypothetical protein
MDMRRFAGLVLFCEVLSAEGGVVCHEQVEESARKEDILAHVAGSREVKCQLSMAPRKSLDAVKA